VECDGRVSAQWSLTRTGRRAPQRVTDPDDQTRVEPRLGEADAVSSTWFGRVAGAGKTAPSQVEGAVSGAPGADRGAGQVGNCSPLPSSPIR
jgi:hypothetical protein